MLKLSRFCHVWDILVVRPVCSIHSTTLHWNYRGKKVVNKHLLKEIHRHPSWQVFLTFKNTLSWDCGCVQAKQILLCLGYSCSSAYLLQMFCTSALHCRRQIAGNKESPQRNASWLLANLSSTVCCIVAILMVRLTFCHSLPILSCQSKIILGNKRDRQRDFIKSFNITHLGKFSQICKLTFVIPFVSEDSLVSKLIHPALPLCSTGWILHWKQSF